jgi:hypothetical protein
MIQHTYLRLEAVRDSARPVCVYSVMGRVPLLAELVSTGQVDLDQVQLQQQPSSVETAEADIR